MYKILICGTENNIDNIIKNLNIDTYVVGYTDIKRKMKLYNSFDGYPYQSLNNHQEGNYDFLVVTYDDNIYINEAREEFKSIEQRIIIYEWFKGATIANPVKKFIQSPIMFEQLILGMSHSENAIQTQLMKRQTFKFSLPSMDLFCHYQVLKKLLEDVPEKMEKVKSIVFELPYYIFNYDLSKSVRSAKKRLYYFRIFENYHNYGMNQEEINVIGQFERYLKIFVYGNPNLKKNNSQECYCLNRSLKDILRLLLFQIKVLTENNRVWKETRELTVQENIQFLERILKLINQRLPDVQITILVCPFNPIFSIKNYKFIWKKRKDFYNILGQYNLTVLDTFLSVKNPFDFLDHCHLNPKAATKYTYLINEKL